MYIQGQSQTGSSSSAKWHFYKPFVTPGNDPVGIGESISNANPPNSNITDEFGYGGNRKYVHRMDLPYGPRS